MLCQTTTRLVGQQHGGQTSGALTFFDGKWKLGKTEFDIRNLATVCDEFTKLKADGKIAAKPLDSLN